MAKGYPDFFRPQAYQILGDWTTLTDGPRHLAAPEAHDAVNFAGMGFVKGGYVTITLDDIDSNAIVTLLNDGVEIAGISIDKTLDLVSLGGKYLALELTYFDLVTLSAYIAYRVEIPFRGSIRIIVNSTLGAGATYTSVFHYQLAK